MEMTGLRVYKVDTSYTRWVYDYLPSNGQVSGISIYIAREENFNMNKKNGSDIQSMSFGMQLEIERSNDERQENFPE